jgi:hypothetical protein
MNTILKTGTATTLLLLALVTAGCADDTVAADAHSVGVAAEPVAAPANAARPTPGASLRRYDSCRLTKAEFMAWIAAGIPQKGCVVDGYRRPTSFGDDRRQPAH